MTAGKKPVTPLGVKELDMQLQDGDTVQMKAEVMDIHKPLCSVAKLIHAGNRVVFDAKGSYIQTTKGDHLTLHEKGGVFLMPAWIQPMGKDLQGCAEDAAKEETKGAGECEGFPGHGK